MLLWCSCARFRGLWLDKARTRHVHGPALHLNRAPHDRHQLLVSSCLCGLSHACTEPRLQAAHWDVAQTWRRAEWPCDMLLGTNQQIVDAVLDGSPVWLQHSGALHEVSGNALPAPTFLWTCVSWTCERLLVIKTPVTPRAAVSQLA